jgi:hypothetical protein
MKEDDDYLLKIHPLAVAERYRRSKKWKWRKIEDATTSMTMK